MKTNLPGAFRFAAALGLLTAVYSLHCAPAAGGTAIEWFNPGYPFVFPGQERVPMPPDLTNTVAIAAGGWFLSPSHSLALRDDGTIVAWGDNSSGQADVPPGLSNVVAIAAGDGHCMALTDEGRVVTWGFDLGKDDITAGLSNVVAIAAGDHRVALKSDGTAVIWGDFPSGPGQPQSPWFRTNLVAISPFVGIMEDGGITTWGLYYGPFPGISNALRVTSCPTRALVQTADNTFHTWGTAPAPPPSHVKEVFAMTCSRSHAAAVLPDGSVVGWNGSPPPPVEVTNATAIASADGYTLALLDEHPPVRRAPMLLPRWDSGGLTLSIEAQSGRVYRLEYKESLADPGWTPLSLVAGRHGQVQLHDPRAPSQQRFYRVRRW
jgi:hypothetical protein